MINEIKGKGYHKSNFGDTPNQQTMSNVQLAIVENHVCEGPILIHIEAIKLYPILALYT